jgi:hypothetical protein
MDDVGARVVSEVSHSVERVFDTSFVQHNALASTSVEMSEESSYLKQIMNFDSYGRESIWGETESNYTDASDTSLLDWFS